MLTHDDVGGDRLRPHNFCKPVAKTRKDRDALIEAATFGSPKFMFGSDSAPHPKEKKEASDCCAGVFTAPIALPLLAEIFERKNALDRLPDFAGGFAWSFYELFDYASAPAKKVTLVKEPMIVPDTYFGVVPFLAGNHISWRVAD
jgi:dihydroorotase